MKTPTLNKLFSLFSSFSILLNSLYAPLTVLAQEASPTPEPTPIVEETTTPAPTQEPTAIPTEIPTVSPEPSQEPTINSTPAATPSVEPTQSETGQLSAVILAETKADSIEEFDLSYREDGSATIQTDKLDYAPTDTVLITGTGFLPNKEYSLEITGTGNFKFSDRVASDESGSLFYSYQLDGVYRPNYKVEVKDGGKVVAITAFTDGNGICNAVDESCGSDNQCCAGLTCQGTGGNKTCQLAGTPTPTPTATPSPTPTSDPGPGWPGCGFQCTAGDTYVTKLELVDGGGNLLNSCNPGELISATIRGTFYNNAGSDRYAVILMGDIYEGNSLITHFQTGGVDGQCVTNTLVPGYTDINIHTFSWTCGETVEIRNLNLSWDTGASTCSDFFAHPRCSQRTTKCYTSSGFQVNTPLVTDFSGNNVCLSDQTIFTDQTTGGVPAATPPPYSYNWDFGDGVGSSTQQNPTYTYANAGSYNTTLSATDFASPAPQSDSETKAVNVWAKPTVNFSASQSTCPGMAVTFTNSSSAGLPNGGQIGSYLWDFDDGTTSTETNPTHNYSTPGDYTVTLTATDTNSCGNQIQKQVTVSECNANLTVRKNLDVDNDGQIESYNVSTWAWDLDAGNQNYQTGSVQSVLIGDHTIFEDTQTNWHVVDLTCNGQSLGAITSALVNVTAAGLECTFTNARDTGNLQVQKVVDFGSVIDWSFSLDGGPSIQADAGGLVDFGQVTTLDNHTIIESGPLGTFYLDSVSGANCTPDILSGSATATVEKDGVTICVFSNLVNRGSITIIKDAIPDNPEDFNFVATGSDVGGFILDDDGDNSNGLSNTQIFSNLLPGSYSFSEGEVAGWDPSLVSCDSSDGNTLEIGRATINLSAGENITCTFVNTKRGLIQGKKFKDNNHNGTRQAGEPYLNNWLITLYQQGDGWQEFKSMQTGDDNTEAGNVDQGQYRFVDLQPGNYLVCEEDRPGWDQTRPTSGPDFNGSICYEVELLPGEEEIGLTFGNFELGKVQGMKFNDEDGDGLPHEVGEAFMDNWTIRLYQNWGEPVGVVTSNTGEQGQFRFTDLLPGTYQVCEVLQEGWGQTWPKAGDYPTGQNGVTHPGFGTAVDNLSGDLDEAPVCWQTTIDTSGEFNYFLRFGNAQLSDIHGFKWNDLNGNGERDCSFSLDSLVTSIELGCEPLLGEWTVFIDKNGNGVLDGKEPSTQTENSGDHLGWYLFSDLLPGSYRVCEVMQEGWNQTSSPQCHTVELPGGVNTCAGPQVNATREALPACNFGNWEVAKGITIEKSNDKGGGANAGETVTYTLKIANTGKMDLTGVEVTDVLPGGFSYVAGSTTIDGIVAGDPVISAGALKWLVGTIEDGKSITLIYRATIPSDAVLGSSFVNYATCYGWALKEEKVDCNVDDSSLTIGKNPGYGGNLTPQVLGAATELPATGSSTWILLLAAVLGILGVGLKALAKMKKIFVWLIILAIPGLILAGPARAMTPQISISKLPEYVNSNSFKLSYSAISDDPASISAQFSYLKEGGSWQSLGAPILGASGQIQVTSSQVDEQMKKYTFKVEITGASDDTTTTYDISGPSPVSNYYKDHSAPDFYKLHWKNPTDGDFAKVIIYRGETPDFSADGSRSIATVAGGADSEMTYDDHTPDGSKTYYYAIRAIDKADNSSSLVGDGGTTTITTTATPASTTTGTAVTVLPKETEGQILPAETEEPKATFSPAGVVQKAADFARNKTKLTVLIFVAISLAGYLLYRRFRKV